MWIWFNDKGILKQQITHDSYARVGSTTFKIFAYFDGIDIEENYTSATIRFQRPDLKKSEYPLLYMKKVSIPFELTDIDGNPDDILFKESEGPYKGYLFDFGNFTQEEDNIVLLDTPGRWEATITLYNSSNRNVVGLITFNVQASVSEVDDDPVELDISTITGNAALESASKVDKEALYYTRTKENFEENANNLSKQIYVADSYVFDPVSSVLYYIDSVTDNDEDTVTATYHVVTDLLTEAEINTILNNYYTKSQVNTLLNNYYTKSQVDNKLGQKVDCRFIEENDTIQNIIDDFGREDHFACYLKVEGDDNGNTVYNYYTIGVTPRSATNSQVEIEDPFSKTRWFALNISNETTFANIIRNSAYLQPYLVSSDLDNYYTKTETDSKLEEKVDCKLVYSTTTLQELIDDLGTTKFSCYLKEQRETANHEIYYMYYTIGVTNTHDGYSQVEIEYTNGKSRWEVADISNAATLSDLMTVAYLQPYLVSSDIVNKANLVNGKVPSSELPSYVDDVIEGYYYNDKFYSDSGHTTEIEGETGKIYVDLSTNESYRYSGSVYISISNPIVVDSALSNVSENPVQNKVIDSALSGKLDASLFAYIDGITEVYESGQLVGADIPSGKLSEMEKKVVVLLIGSTLYYSAYQYQTPRVFYPFITQYGVSGSQTGLFIDTYTFSYGNTRLTRTQTRRVPVSTSISNNDVNPVTGGAIYNALGTKQDTLVSGTNIKTINGESLLGSSNIVITGAGTIDPTLSASSTNAIQNRAVAMALNGKIVYATLNTGDTIQTYINKFGESTIFATFETGTRVWIIRVYNLYSTTYDISLFCPATLERYTQTVSGTSTTIYSVIASANQDNVSTLHLYKHQIDLGASSPSVIIELISADKTKYDNNSNATSLLPLYCDANSPYKATLRIGSSYYYLLGAEVTGSSTMFSGYTITFYYQSSTTNTIQTYSFTLGTISDTVTEV